MPLRKRKPTSPGRRFQVSGPNRRFGPEVKALRPTRQSRIGLRTGGNL